MFTRKFFISWLFSSIIMFSAFFLWHGVLLNDFSHSPYPKDIFLTVSSLVYLIIGFALNSVYDSRLLEKFPKKPRLKGVVVGAVCGIFIYFMSVVIGVSFNGQMTFMNVVVNITWQMAEQALGGLAIGIVHIFAFRRNPFIG
ncbi:MAG TPA: hypothetical protein VNG53_09270 [Bacteroidia bacterium]|nr:hypothetical protein [Bacteroidia bacterium]